MTGEWRDIATGGRDWLRLVTASKVAAILGVSPYESPSSLWWKMRGDVEPDAQTTAQSRGHYLEPAILAWFADQHPDWHMAANKKTFVRESWMGACPDATANVGEGHANDFALVEAKSSSTGDGWGAEGTDEIPTGYAAQCMWQAHVCGAERVYVPMIGPWLEFREYVVDYDPKLAAAIEAKCRAFYDSLAGDTPPPLDEHPETYRTIRRLHPLIEERAVSVDDKTATDYLTAKAALDTAKAAMTAAQSALAAAMGDAKTAVHQDRTIATRQSKQGGTPYVQAARNLRTTA